ncbi:MAG: hypothetical protein K9L79_01475 [Methylobacter tundripaludum]|nr:hypothetical protein [Methylobacter tundripaludum]
MLGIIKRFLSKKAVAFRCPTFRGAAMPGINSTSATLKIDLPDWSAIYQQLDAKHGIAQRGISLYLFLRNPEQHEYWINFFFNNVALFKDRVGLHFFINHDPEHIVSVLQAHKRTPVVSELMCSSQVERISDSAATLIQPRRCKQLRDVCFKNGRFIQPITPHRYNPRYKRAHR